MTLGTRVRYYRQKLGWTLEVLAEKSGVEIGTISALEKRRSEKSKYSQDLAAGFGLSLEELLDEERDWLAQPRPLSPPALVQAPSSPTHDLWPFRDVSREHYFQLLTDADRSEITGFVKGLLKARQAKAAAA